MTALHDRRRPRPRPPEGGGVMGRRHLNRRRAYRAAIAAVGPMPESVERSPNPDMGTAWERWAKRLAVAYRDLAEDKAANRWVDEQMQQLGVRYADFRAGRWEMSLSMAREMAAAFTAMAKTMLCDSPNYTETRLEFDVKIAESPEVYTLVVQRHAPGALTPHEARQKAEAERDEAVERARAAEEKLRAAGMLRCWTNEDGRKFVFADDLAEALGIKQLPAVGQWQQRVEAELRQLRAHWREVHRALIDGLPPGRVLDLMDSADREYTFALADERARADKERRPICHCDREIEPGEDHSQCYPGMANE